ncbi:MAG: efflux RND transporter periplasmic adaptor subunit [Candidatus Solibacter sp.]
MLAGLALAAAGWYLRPQPQRSSGAGVKTVKAVRGVVQQKRRISGSIAAGQFANIGAPLLQGPTSDRGLTLIYLADSGTLVKRGDLIARFDARDIEDRLQDIESNVLQGKLEIERRRAQLAAQMENFKQRLRVAKATWDKALLEARTIPVRNSITAETLRLSAEEYQEAYEEALTQMPLTEERQVADNRIVELNYERNQRYRDRYKRDVEQCSVRSPIDGMVVMQTLYRGGQMNQIKVGDEIRPGQPFMRVVEPKSMLLDATMNQAESELIRLGQKAAIHFDAFPDIAMRGHVASVGALATSGRRVQFVLRTIPVRLALDSMDPRLMPDLSASADVETAPAADGLLVPVEAMSEAGGKTIVYVKQGNAFVAREVAIAGSSHTHVALRSGIQEGEEIALTPQLASAAVMD